MISFVIPAKNEERYIVECIRSIYAQQIAVPIEIVVVNNNSTDATEAVVKSNFPDVAVIFELTPGTNHARQAGFEQAKGEIVCFLDADVRLPSGWVERIIKTLRSEERIVAVSGPYRFYDFPWYWNMLNEMFLYLVLAPFFTIVEFFQIGAQLVGGNMAIKKSALTQIGGFNTSLKFYGDDSMTAMQLRTLGRVVFSRRYCVYSSARRYTAEGIVRTTSKYILNYFWILFRGRPYHEEADVVR